MRFKQYLEELALTPQVVSNTETINDELLSVLEGIVSSPEIGLQKINETLAKHGIALPMFHDILPDGDELVIDLNENDHLYIIYSELDMGGYEFFSEITDTEGLHEILSDDEDDFEDIE